MKKLAIITAVFGGIISLVSCGGASGNDPGRAYMPDMYYSRAYEAYGYNNVNGEYDSLRSRDIRYNGMPVLGTVARGETAPYRLMEGDSGYAQAATMPSLLTGMTLTPAQTKEAERIYLINCAICHGTALDGNGPLWKGGDGPYPAAPRNLKDDHTKALSDAQIYHAITFGKGPMGSYASQVKPEQRWWIINYIRSKQGGGATATDSTAAGTTGTAPAAAGGAGSAGGTTTTGAATAGGNTMKSN
jgi:mono/diheme cytochrome c family protein